MSADDSEEDTPSDPSEDPASLSLLDRIDKVNDAFDAAWRAGQEPKLEQCLAQFSETERRETLRLLLKVELSYRRQRGDDPTPDEYRARFPEYEDAIDAAFGKSTSTVDPGATIPPGVRAHRPPPALGSARFARSPGEAWARFSSPATRSSTGWSP